MSSYVQLINLSSNPIASCETNMEYQLSRKQITQFIRMYFILILGALVNEVQSRALQDTFT